ncbi:uncharacterized protein METZ01_LOCUS113278 [marine metagenome]|jgi:hypothetical protein|uniref:Uncharacterized protein n=1 Tax=marine metagenome TaxID=408172 RepID=A0A381X6S6_9ZZZZ|tara:strand:+ start:406 stop:804 length:399 start_codon:yes stop_codon:yes gene_type:complete
MRDVYQTAFYGVVKETQESSGLTLPNDIECYVVMLLADHIDKNDFLPKKSFAESYLTIRKSSNAKELGDTCLFVSGVFPAYGNTDYFVEIGRSSYSRITTLNHELFESLSKHFIFLRDFIELSTTNPYSRFS